MGYILSSDHKRIYRFLKKKMRKRIKETKRKHKERNYKDKSRGWERKKNLKAETEYRKQ